MIVSKLSLAIAAAYNQNQWEYVRVMFHPTYKGWLHHVS